MSRWLSLVLQPNDGTWDLLRIPPHPSADIIWSMKHLATSSMQVKMRTQTGKMPKEAALWVKCPGWCLCYCVNLKFTFPPWVLLSSTVKKKRGGGKKEKEKKNLAQQKVNREWFHRRLTGQDRWLTAPSLMMKRKSGKKKLIDIGIKKTIGEEESRHDMIRGG